MGCEKRTKIFLGMLKKVVIFWGIKYELLSSKFVGRDLGHAPIINYLKLLEKSLS